jgi:hypothetical protein
MHYRKTTNFFLKKERPIKLNPIFVLHFPTSLNRLKRKNTQEEMNKQTKKIKEKRKKTKKKMNKQTKKKKKNSWKSISGQPSATARTLSVGFPS